MRSRRGVFFIVSTALLLVGAIFVLHQFAAPADVSNDPSYHFGSLPGTTWKSKVPLALADVNGDMFIYEAEPTFVEQHKRFLKDPNYRDGGRRVLAILPAGAVIKFEKLINGGGTLGTLLVESELVSSPFAQKEIVFDTGLFLPNDFTFSGRGLARTWVPDPAKFSRVE